MDNGGARRRIGHGGPAWDIWELGNWSATATASSYNHRAVASSSACSAFADNAVPPDGGSIRCGGDHHHLTCLKLGKRQYYGEEGAAAVGMKRPSPSAAVSRCQVEGCNKPLVDAKDYHRRHKVCEAHSKAPRVVVHGVEQRFCQQCSRFHAVSEFDDSKRSCRRRLAGHNERRRKSSGIAAINTTNNEFIIRNPQSLESTVMCSRFPYESSLSCAPSLLSSKASPWVSTSDLPSRSSAALRELIAENRAAVLARQLFSDRGGWHDVDPRKHAAASYMPHQHQVQSQAPAQLTNGWNQFQDSGGQLTVDLMQMPGSSFDILSGKM